VYVWRGGAYCGRRGLKRRECSEGGVGGKRGLSIWLMVLEGWGG